MAARAAVVQAEAAHAEAARTMGRYDNLLAAIDENEKRARAELEGLRTNLAGACANVARSAPFPDITNLSQSRPVGGRTRLLE